MPSVGLQNGVCLSRWRFIHKASTVQLDSAHVFVAFPYVYMGRLTKVFPRVYAEAEPPFLCGDWHPLLLTLNQFFDTICIINDTFVKGRISETRV